ncbi:unnamed protein product [Caenorhabditis angaria]|uniref:Fungal lipase-type domain-containing protein n=1 Tax=Caenorhabditis angaria TaxID=860376 RepID=A0A9P1IXN0_9PELO|nr:unnamed protein product [Caenorhabditis angaria]
MKAIILLALVGVMVMAVPFKTETSTQYTIPYNDATARKKLIYASGAAYGSNPQACLDKVFNGAQLRRRVETRCDASPTDKCVGYTAVSTDDKAIIIVFRGTTNNVQLIMEGLETIFTYHTPWSAGGVVSTYFNDGFLNLWNGGIKDDFNTLVAKYPGYQVWITGHSLGGAMASLAASYITYNKLYDNTKVQLVTFGEPRVGDQAYATSFDKYVPNGFRVTHAHDPVPHLPTQNLQNYTHHKAEVYYKEKMTKYLICDDVDESSFCSNGNVLPDGSISDHLNYFDVNVSDLGYSNCAHA